MFVRNTYKSRHGIKAIASGLLTIITIGVNGLIKMVRFLPTSVLLCPLFINALGRLNSSEPLLVSTYEDKSDLPIESRQYSSGDKSYSKSYPSSYLRNMGNFGHGWLAEARRIKTRREEHSMPDFEDVQDPSMLEKPLPYKYDYKYRPMNTGHGYLYGEPYSYHMNDLMADGKEALTAFGLGLAAGLGLLGLLSGLLKLFIGPLAFGTFLSLLLVLAAPVPVLSTGKMLLTSFPKKKKKFEKQDLQDTLQQIARKLPDFNVVPTNKVTN